MHKKIAAALAVLILSGAGLFGQTIKMASVAPLNSPWDNSLKKLAAEWFRISGGRIDVKIYPGGIAGSEDDMVRKMRIGTLNASAFTTVGLQSVHRDFIIMSMPLLFRSDAELDYTFENMKPYFEQKFREKGFTIVTWTTSGWTRFFSRHPVVYPEDLKSQVLAVTEGDAELTQVWRRLGFRVAPGNMNEVMTGLQNGMLDAFFSPPVAAAAYQWFALAKNMSTLDFAPLLVGVVVDNRTWDRVPASMRPELLKAADAVMKESYEEIKKVDEEALKLMTANGLKINKITPDAQKRWEEQITQGFEAIIGKSFSAEVYQLVKKHTADYRKANAQ
jgi:TRAP-type C4-dicarboxylate transport system substrate-binding protein